MIKNLYFGLSRCFLFFTAPLFYILCGLIAGAYFQHGVFWIALFFCFCCLFDLYMTGLIVGCIFPIYQLL